MVYQGSYDLRRDVDKLKKKVDDGSVDSESYFLETSTPVVTYTTTFTPSNITFRSYKIVNGFTDAFDCTLTIEGSNDGSTYTVISTKTGHSISISVSLDYKYYRCTMSVDDNVLDYQTVRVVDGSSDTISVFLGNESQLIPCDNEGRLIDTFSFEVPYYCYKGVGKYPCQFYRKDSNIPSWMSYSNIDATSSNAGKLIFTVNNTPSYNQGWFTLAFKVDTEVIYCIFNYARTKDGIDGETGEDGVDGNGYHYIYYRTLTSDKPATPTSSTVIIDNSSRSGEELEGDEWFEEAITPTAQYPYLWCSFRVYNGEQQEWGAFCTPYLKEKYTYYGSNGEVGADGLHGADGNLITGDEVEDKTTDTTSKAMQDSVPSNFVTQTTQHESFTIGQYDTHVHRQGDIVSINLHATLTTSAREREQYVNLLTLPNWAYPASTTYFADIVHTIDEQLRYRIIVDKGVAKIQYWDLTGLARPLNMAGSITYIVDDSLRPTTSIRKLSGEHIGQGEALTVQLIDDENQAIPNEKLYFKINGVIYQRETNLAGVASVNMNLSGNQEIAVWYDGYNYDDGEITSLNTNHSKSQSVFNIFVRSAFINQINWGLDESKGYYTEVKTNTGVPLRYHPIDISINGSELWTSQTDGDGKVYFDLWGYDNDVEVYVRVNESNRVYDTVYEKHIFNVLKDKTYTRVFPPSKITGASFEDVSVDNISSIGDMKYIKSNEIGYNSPLGHLVLDYTDLDLPLSAIVQKVNVQVRFCGLEGAKPLSRPSWKAPLLTLNVDDDTVELNGRPNSVVCDYTNCGVWKTVNYSTTLSNTDISPANLDKIWNTLKLTLSDLTNYGGGEQHQDSGRFAVDYIKLSIDYKLNENSSLIPSAIPSVVIYAEDLSKYEGGSERYTARLYIDGEPVRGEELSIMINGMSFTRETDIKGEVSVGVNLLRGNYPVSVSYTSDDVTVTKNAVIKVNPRIIAHDLIKRHRCPEQFIVELYNTDGSPAPLQEVTFIANGVSYTRRSDEFGIVKVNVNLEPNTYGFTVVWDGVQTIAECVITPVLFANDLVKQYGDSTPFIANLINCDGEPAVGESIIFSVNGIQYTRTTDEYGDAKLNINLREGRYVVTTTYDGFSISNNITITA